MSTMKGKDGMSGIVGRAASPRPAAPRAGGPRPWVPMQGKQYRDNVLDGLSYMPEEQVRQIATDNELVQDKDSRDRIRTVFTAVPAHSDTVPNASVGQKTHRYWVVSDACFDFVRDKGPHAQKTWPYLTSACHKKRQQLELQQSAMATSSVSVQKHGGASGASTIAELDAVRSMLSVHLLDFENGVFAPSFFSAPDVQLNKDAEAWQAKLRRVSALANALGDLQRAWCGVESTFSELLACDTAQWQLRPMDDAAMDNFKTADTYWRAVVAQAAGCDSWLSWDADGESGINAIIQECAANKDRLTASAGDLTTWTESTRRAIPRCW